jgi:hypothetical protein
MHKTFLVLIVALLFHCSNIFSKVDPSNFYSIKQQNILRLNALFDSILKVNNDLKRLDINKEVDTYIENLIIPAQAFTDTFKQIKKIGKLFSPDKKFCIITWNVPLIDGQNIFFGYIQLNPGKDSICRIFKLTDVSNSTSNINLKVAYKPDQWIGALYYEIIAEKINKNIVYILLGSRLNDMKTSKKIIETFSFTKEGQPYFGLPVIDNSGVMQARIQFEYAIAISMTLRYNKKLEMIVFDHLSPSSPIYKGDYKFYGPDFSYDGLKFEKSKWTYKPDVKVF